MVNADGTILTIMINRIDAKFKELKAKKKKAFIAFISAGDPTLSMTQDLVLAFEDSGVDIIELGIPFSDPLADGLTIQASSQRAIKGGVTLEKILKTVEQIRLKSQIPIAFMTYYNPILHFGEKAFVARAKNSGVDGLIIPDLPPEEAGVLIKSARNEDLATIFFLSPTSSPERIKMVAKVSTGFIYYVSLTGVTGMRDELPQTVLEDVKRIKGNTKKPVCVGFGISKPKQVTSVGRISDGVIVGSAIIKEIEKNIGKKDLVKKVSRFVSQLSGNV